MTSMNHFAGQIAIVTGASSGIGKRIAVRLAESGATVVLAARSEAPLHSLAEDLRIRGYRAEAVPTDVSDAASLDNLVKTTLRKFDRIDVLVNNAGVDLFEPSESASLAAIAQTVQVNLTGTLLLSRLVLPTMCARKSGSIVHVSSTSGLFGAAFGSVYAATKAGQIAHARSLRAEYGSRGISAAVVCPGFTDGGGIYERLKTESGKGTPTLMGETTDETVAEAVLKTLRKGTPERIVNFPPYRPLLVLQGLAPKLTGWLVSKASRRFLKRVASRKSSSEDVRRAA